MFWQSTTHCRRLRLCQAQNLRSLNARIALQYFWLSAFCLFADMHNDKTMRPRNKENLDVGITWLVYFAVRTEGVEHLVCQSRAGHLLLFVSVCKWDQRAWIIDDSVSICIYLGRKCNEFIIWLAACIVCCSGPGSNRILGLFVWGSVGDSYTFLDACLDQWNSFDQNHRSLRDLIRSFRPKSLRTSHIKTTGWVLLKHFFTHRTLFTVFLRVQVYKVV